jgi:catechol 2,3-dioxygenase-like lactoylglutathione lyase family enzyme
MASEQHLPIRLHHTAYVTRDLEATRRFYEDVIGMPLIATWCESDELFGRTRTYCHTFFGMADGGALAFFQFADPEDQEEFGPKMPSSPFHHIALAVDAKTQNAIEERIAAAGIQPPDTYILEHGYCRSVYVKDPNGMILEFTLDHPESDRISSTRRADARQELNRWLAGDHTTNNTYR